MMDTKENCWKFFINRVRNLLKCILCFSPVGATLRNRARQFPAIVNNTSINWFQSWPQDALRSVSTRFLEVRQFSTFFIKLISHLVNLIYLKTSVWMKTDIIFYILLDYLLHWNVYKINLSRVSLYHISAICTVLFFGKDDRRWFLEKV